MKTKKQEMLHPDIQPELAKAMRTVRALFVKNPEAYNGLGLTYRVRQSGVGCIACHVAHKLGYDSNEETMRNFPSSREALTDMMSASTHHVSDPEWAVARIDRFLRTNT